MSDWQVWNDMVICDNQNSILVPCATHSAICGQDGIIWAKSDNFSLSPEFFKTVQFLFENNKPSEDGTKLEIDINGEKESHMVFSVESEDVILAKKGTSGMTVAKGKTCYVIGIYDETMCHGNNRKRVAMVRDELMKNHL